MAVSENTIPLPGRRRRRPARIRRGRLMRPSWRLQSVPIPASGLLLALLDGAWHREPVTVTVGGRRLQRVFLAFLVAPALADRLAEFGAEAEDAEDADPAEDDDPAGGAIDDQPQLVGARA